MAKAVNRWTMATALVLGGVIAQAMVNQAVAQRNIQTVTSMSSAERAEGAKAHPELLKEFGGLYQGPQAAYVVQVGRKIAVQSSLSSQQNDFTVSLLNSQVNNAFAIPGGYVYVTRQLLALMNDEAELAGVLGHEVGHVAAQHGKKRQSAAQRNSILGALGQVLIGAVAGDSAFGSLLQRGVGQGAQLLTLKFSRTQEYEADDLGIRYLARAGYDPEALSSMLASLAAQTTLDSQVSGTPSSIPEWASTHPDPASRVQRALTNARAIRSSSKLRNADVFIGQLDGLLYGDDPAQGIVTNGQFMHPGLKLKFRVPTGFAVDNQADAVSISGQSAKAQFAGAPFNGNLDAYVQSVFVGLAGQGSQIPTIPTERTTINGLPVSYGRATMTNSQGSRLTVTVLAYQFSNNSAYHFLVVTPAGQGLGALQPMIDSVSRLSDQEAANVKARRIKLVTVKNGDTAASLARQMAYEDHQLERFQVLNGLRNNAAVTPGKKVKLVTF
jgi:predicted Zn-dependent protease